ncbi:hypothetical protein WICMUC_005163 [Wickerhamomyces mucosus]|uniref:Uncharacterized protein n=1 Tax=Wickerhamomyces mucosus TaxID=1378264 RepID=A0A9P8PAB3_9ASCO|nr:hypothetical protein WICMUC_005163 [Wickerhamomyces mucosus]
MKRSHTPTIEEIRQFNIKRSKIIENLSHLSLDKQQPSSPSNVEVINDIDEYLIRNQTDEEIIQTNNHIHFNIPNKEYIPSAGWDRKYAQDYYLQWSLIKYHEPWRYIKRVWENWWINDYRLKLFYKQLYVDDYIPEPRIYEIENDEDEQNIMVDDSDYVQPSNYYDYSTNISYDIPIETQRKKFINENAYGNYYDNELMNDEVRNYEGNSDNGNYKPIEIHDEEMMDVDG